MWVSALGQEHAITQKPIYIFFHHFGAELCRLAKSELFSNVSRECAFVRKCGIATACEAHMMEVLRNSDWVTGWLLRYQTIDICSRLGYKYPSPNCLSSFPHVHGSPTHPINHSNSPILPALRISTNPIDQQNAKGKLSAQFPQANLFTALFT
ncbi:hypothetical protein CROQUDRAFT_88459 [Cronartium quercuum f. sp. fusiforme G11]|uniref:Uncharacterized protein n=1 Tax=Cronartium quercuum f. sp. fusiforme G11 TaxID=708437 RepID=A0A9P6NT66_9BASI|nr:hypothetical protein CROQUDRAFT_88459 [Cronartium quercuum f. sp. fusiforme G11]